MSAEQSKGGFAAELNAFKAKHGQEAESLRIVKIVDEHGAAVAKVSSGTNLNCTVLPDGNMYCESSKRE